MEDYKLIERIPTAKELNKLKNLVRWGIIDEEVLKIGLDNSLYGVCIAIDENVINYWG